MSTEFGRRYPAVIGGREYQGEEAIVSVNPARPGRSRRDGHCRQPGTGAGGIERRPPGTAGMGTHQSRRSCRSPLPGSRRCPLTPAGTHGLADFRDRQELGGGRCRRRRGHRFHGILWTRDAPARRSLQNGRYPGRRQPLLLPAEGRGTGDRTLEFSAGYLRGNGFAALVAGNTVLYKPSSVSVVNGWQLCSLFREAGVPEGVFNFIPGRGDLVGEWLAATAGSRPDRFYRFAGCGAWTDRGQPVACRDNVR